MKTLSRLVWTVAAVAVAAPAPPIPALVGAAPEPVKIAGLTSKQLLIVAVLFVGVFAAMFLVLMKFGR